MPLDVQMSALGKGGTNANMSTLGQSPGFPRESEMQANRHLTVSQLLG